MKLGDILYKEIEHDQFYINTYNDLLFNLSIKELSLNLEPKPIDLQKTLRYADLLSKSTSKDKADEHKIVAQEMIAILDKLNPNNSEIKYFMGTILTNNGNYRGRDKMVPQYRNLDSMDDLIDCINKLILSIPGEDDKNFFFQQKQVFENLNCKYYSYSGPTSMGKTFIIRMFIKNQIINDIKTNYAIIVPSKALISEISRSIIKDLNQLLVTKSYKVVTTGNSTLLEKKGNFIFVLTPERLLYLLMEKPNVKLAHIFIDEAHKISILDPRSTFYYKVVSLAETNNCETKFSFASPNISNPNEFLRLVSNKSQDNINTSSCKYSPVSQIKYTIDFKNGKASYYNSRMKSLIPIEANVSENNLIDFIYKNKFNEQSIVYCNRKATALDYAKAYYDKIITTSNKTYDNDLLKVSEQIKNDIHPDYLLAEYIKYGVAFHVGFVPISVRTAIEQLFKEGKIKIVFCTSTLIEGVNLPAENLFITSPKNGKHDLSLIDFKNLTGRVGRIEFNLYGKVFLVRDKEDDSNDYDKYKRLLTTDDYSTQLSLITNITDEERNEIVKTLKTGSTLLSQNEITKRNYKTLRKLLNILLKDILCKRKTIILESFSTVLTSNDQENIRNIFDKEKEIIDDDINHTLDQVKDIDEGILNEDLKYPKLSPGVKYNTLFDFLTKLAEKFKWYYYDKEDIGYQDKKGNYTLLRRYASILMNWMNGTPIKEIINSSIQYQTQEDANFQKNIKKVNDEICNILEIIENIILFKISNYFLRFSNEYKRIHKISSLSNDWYEYVEYGSIHQPVILLQKLGFTRETAILIRTLNEYKFINGKFFISKNLLNSKNVNIRNESNDLYYNLKDIFIDM